MTELTKGVKCRKDLRFSLAVDVLAGNKMSSLEFHSLTNNEYYLNERVSFLLKEAKRTAVQTGIRRDSELCNLLLGLHSVTSEMKELGFSETMDPRLFHGSDFDHVRAAARVVAGANDFTIQNL